MSKLKSQPWWLDSKQTPSDNPGAIQKSQVRTIRNDCAGADWPVGALCWILGFCPLTGVGTGGFNGFDQLDSNGMGKNNRYLLGGHGAALESEFHSEIAEFLVTGSELETSRKSDENRRILLLWCLRFSFLIGAVAIVGIYKFIPTLSSAELVLTSSAIFTFIIIRVLMQL